MGKSAKRKAAEKPRKLVARTAASKAVLSKEAARKPKVRKVLKAATKALKPKRVKAALSGVPSAAAVMDRLWQVVQERRKADPETSHSARLLSRGMAKVAQKFGEEAVECLIEAVAGNQAALVAESADVLYHLIVVWVAAGVEPSEVWAELTRREGISGIAEKAARAQVPTRALGLATTKIP
ncbi:MAG: phosphoribosyl-ATP diphosphatase [Rhodospirillales bacterium]|nr:phosphoribosyl-ATP diphosphatase [Rhodospirillales bacterium]